MFCDDELGQASDIAPFAVDAALQIVFGAVNEADDVGVLLDSTRLTQVRQLRAFSVGSVLDASVELRQGDYRNVELLGELFE